MQQRPTFRQNTSFHVFPASKESKTGEAKSVSSDELDTRKSWIAAIRRDERNGYGYHHAIQYSGVLNCSNHFTDEYYSRYRRYPSGVQPGYLARFEDSDIQ